MINRKLITAIILFVFFSACTGTKKTVKSTETSSQKELNEKPRNIILLIGDGMGVTQISAGMYMQEGDKTSFERFKNIGLHKSHSHSDLITDSAAGATAFSCGVKTFNEAIAVDKDSIPVRTILEDAETSGMNTGMVVTSTIVHATPASFIAHADDRHDYEKIAAYFPESGVDILIGGGMKYFYDRKTDNRNIIKEMRNNHYKIDDYSTSSIADMRFKSGSKYAFFTAEDDPAKHSEGRTYLPDATRKAMSFLDNSSDNGFFLMVEGSQIDWGGHANDSDYLLEEMVEFDRVVGQVLDWAEHDGETLVIVTGDHECGGYAINPGSERGDINGAFTATYHTAAMIPVFAYGPDAEMFRGIYQNTAIYDKMMEALGLY